MAAFNECERIENTYSRFIKSSDLSRLNGKLGSWQKVSPEFFMLLQYAENIRKMSNGAFNIGIESILSSWGYDADYSLLENGKGVCATVQLKQPNLVHLTAPIDFGGLGKGYALNRMKQCMNGVEDFLIDAGGDLYACGKNHQNKPWKIVFEHPKDVTLEIDDLFMASSSPSRRKWRQFHHLVNPIKKQPADDMLITFVQGQDGMLCDAFSTALFAMGFEQAKSILDDLPLEAALVATNGKVMKSKGFVGEFYKS